MAASHSRQPKHANKPAKRSTKKIFNNDLFKLVVAGVCTLLVLCIHYFFREEIFSNLLMFLLAIPVQFYCGWNFITGAWRSLAKKTPNMDLLVAAGTLITFFYSVYIMLAGGLPYFETSCLLIVFISFGEYVEDKAKAQSNKVIDSLVNLVPKKMHKVLDMHSDEELIENFNDSFDYKLQDCLSTKAKVGDYIFVKNGESIPADSIVILGEAEVDESMLTGESELATKRHNDDINAGTILASGQVIARVVHSNKDSVLAKIIQAVKDAQSSKASVARIADKVARIFVPVVFGIALITFILWAIFTPGLVVEKINYAMMSSVSILIVACPCALVLATPITLTVGMGRAAQLGIIIRNASVLENMCKIKNMVFDKTGTLTKSNLDKNAKAAKTLRSDAKETVSELNNKLKMNTYMISGDKKTEAFRIAEQIGIEKENVVAEADPISKNDCLIKLMDDAKTNNKKAGLFAYVGDGINDALAMTTADVGITLESATDIALETGDVVLMHNKLLDLITAFRLSKASMRKIKQNLFWALFYNIVFIPLAAFGIMLPIWCGAIHAVSSLIVVFNALLLKRFK